MYFGFSIKITFKTISPYLLWQVIPKIITQIASTATKNFGGQKQLISSPTAKVIATTPLLTFLLHFLIFLPPLLHIKQNFKKGYFIFNNTCKLENYLL